jgi:hypothetical protein
MSGQQVKGTGIIPVISYIKAHYGDEAWAGLVQRLPQPARDVLSRRVMPITWYPHEVVAQLYDAICDEFGKGNPKFCWTVGKDAADYGLSLIYKFFLSFGSPMMFGSKGPEMWKTYYQPSTLEVLRNEKGAISLAIHDLQTSLAHLYSVAGWMERAGELTGGKNIKVEVDPETLRFEITYE